MKRSPLTLWLLPLALALLAGGCATSDIPTNPDIVVNSLEDTANPPSGEATLGGEFLGTFTTDQRGNARLNGAKGDIGAIER